MMFIFLGDSQNPNSFKLNSGKMASWRAFRIWSQKLSMSNTKCIIWFAHLKLWFITMFTEKDGSGMEVAKKGGCQKENGKNQ